MKIPQLGILQGRLTPSPDGSIQFFPKDNWRNEFVLAKSIGFDCMELLVKSDSWGESPLLDFRCIGELERLSRDYAISTPSVHGFYDKSDEYLTTFTSIVYGASLLAVKTILISFFGNNALNNEADKDLSLKQLSKVLPICERKGIRIGIETEMPAAGLFDFIRLLNRSNVGVYYDIGNMASMGVDVAGEIRFLGDLICGVHVKDRKANGGETVPLGDGCADLDGAFRALCEIGYGGPFIIQGARSSEVDDVVLNKRYFNFCRGLLAETYGERSAK